MGEMIQLFNPPTWPVIDCSEFDHLLNGSIVEEFEQEFAEYVGAKYACGTNSCTNAITMTLEWCIRSGIEQVRVPTMIPHQIVTGKLLFEFFHY